MTLYTAFLSMAPFILLAVTKGAFGPWGMREGDEWQASFLFDVAMVLVVVAGAVICVLVLGDILAATPTTRWVVVVAGVLSLLLLAVHMLWEVVARYRRSNERT